MQDLIPLLRSSHEASARIAALLASAPIAAFIAVAPLAAFVASARPATAQCAHWTDDFAAPGFDSLVHATLVFDDGTGMALYAGGSFTHAPGVSARGIARWNGTSWSEVGGGLNGTVTSLVVFDDGTGRKLLAGGQIPGSFLGSIVAWENGQWVPYAAPVPESKEFGSSQLLTLAVFDAGSGSRLYGGGSFDGAIRRWNGASWEIVGQSLHLGPFDDFPYVTSLLVHDDGSGPALYVAGQFDRLGSQGGQGISKNVARTNGTTWTSVGNGLDFGYAQDVQTLCVFDDGNGVALYAGGTFASPALSHVARLSGSTWVPLGTGVDGPVMRLSAPGPVAGVPSGLWVSGAFQHAGGQPIPTLALWNGASFGSVGTGHLGQDGTNVAVLDDGSGHGARAFGAAFNGVVEVLESGSWSLLSPATGANREVTSLALTSAGGPTRELFVAGRFDVIGGVTAQGLARFDGTAWHPEILPGAPDRVDGVFVLDVGAGEEVFATVRHGFGGPGFPNVLRRTNGAWNPLPVVPTFSNAPPRVLGVFDAGGGKQLYAGGGFGLWRLDGGAWTSVIPQPNREVVALVEWDDGSGPALYLAGNFESIGGVAYNAIARWDGTTLSDVAGGTNPFGRVIALQVWDDGTGPALFAMGRFTSMGGVPSAGLAKWNGQSWSDAGADLDISFVIEGDMAVHDDHSGAGSELVLAGLFSTAGGQTVGNIARWNGTTWRTMDGGVAGGTQTGMPLSWVSALAVLDVGDGSGPDLYAGGHFNNAGLEEASCLARWMSCGGTASTFCFGDGSGTACPCGNASAQADEAGCLNSLGMGGTLRAHGRASLSDDTLVLEGGSMPDASVLYYQGASLVSGGAGVTFGDGVKCTAGPFVRLGTKLNAGGASAYPGAGDPQLSLRGHVIAPGTRHYQARYRNAAAFCTPDTFNYTSGVSVAWSP